nr:hypothetical protein [Bergeyella cardium]
MSFSFSPIKPARDGIGFVLQATSYGICGEVRVEEVGICGLIPDDGFLLAVLVVRLSPDGICTAELEVGLGFYREQATATSALGFVPLFLGLLEGGGERGEGDLLPQKLLSGVFVGGTESVIPEEVVFVDFCLDAIRLLLCAAEDGSKQH